jgi:hypothetical protein
MQYRSTRSSSAIGGSAHLPSRAPRRCVQPMRAHAAAMRSRSAALAQRRAYEAYQV